MTSPAAVVIAPPLRLQARLLSIDGLRGFAALAVLLFHANAFFWRVPHPVPSLAHSIAAHSLAYGHYGVTLFFIISGFCIHLPYAGRRSISARQFVVRRFWRLYPAYLATFLLVFVLNFAQSHTLTRGALLNFLGHFVFWHFAGDGIANGMGLSPVLWTIAVEVQFYILYLLLRPLLVRLGFGRAAVLGWLIDVAYHAALAKFDPAYGLMFALTPRRLALTRFGEWLLGAWVADAYASGALARLLPAGRRALVAAAGIGLVCLGIASESTATRGPWNQGDPLLALAFTAIAAALVAYESRHKEQVVAADATRPMLRFLDWSASRSYSLYLLHFTVLASVGLAYARVRHVNRDAIGGSRQWLIVTLVGIVGALICAEAMYRLVEAPSHRLARRLAGSRRATPVTPATAPAGV